MTWTRQGCEGLLSFQNRTLAGSGGAHIYSQPSGAYHGRTKFEASLGYIARPCVSKQNKIKQNNRTLQTGVVTEDVNDM